jgi:hypothetical protein
MRQIPAASRVAPDRANYIRTEDGHVFRLPTYALSSRLAIVVQNGRISHELAKRAKGVEAMAALRHSGDALLFAAAVVGATWFHGPPVPTDRPPTVGILDVSQDWREFDTPTEWRDYGEAILEELEVYGYTPTRVVELFSAVAPHLLAAVAALQEKEVTKKADFSEPPPGS